MSSRLSRKSRVRQANNTVIHYRNNRIRRKPKNERKKLMSTLVVIEYDDPFKAEEVRISLMKLHKDYLIDLEDAVVAVKDQKGKVRLHQAVNLTAAGALSGGFWGLLIGMIFLNPLLGMAMGAAAGAVSGALRDVGINDNFMKDLTENMKPSSSTLFVLVRKVTPDKVLDEIKGTGGKVLQTSLSHEDEAKRQQRNCCCNSSEVLSSRCELEFDGGTSGLPEGAYGRPLSNDLRSRD